MQALRTFLRRTPQQYGDFLALARVRATAGLPSRCYVTTTTGSGDATKGPTEPTGQAEAPGQELASREAQMKELKDSYLLALADMENLRQRTKREVEAASQFAIQRFCKDVISVADILEMALAAAKQPDGPTGPAKQLTDMLAGLSMTLAELHKVFAKHGVTPIEPLHQKFDPNLHNALFEVANGEVESGTIVSVQKKGYLLHHRVIRPADVGVARRPA